MRKAFHVNLLFPEERVSSSPLRPRVLLPAIAVLAVLAMFVWWGVVFTQLSIVQYQLGAVKGRMQNGKSAHDAVVENMNLVQQYEGEFAQLSLYRNGRRTYGSELAEFAAKLPESVQLVSMSVPPPPPQLLTDPKKPKAKPLLGPTGTVETVSFRFTGRSLDESSIVSFLETLGEPAFTNMLVVAQASAKVAASPRIHSFRQEAAGTGKDGPQMLAFDVEFRCRERTFAK